MEISRKADYALRAVLYIAQAKSLRPTINEIARSEKIPREFLAKVLLDLTEAQILKSFQGVSGGYQLARRPAQITMLEVVEAISGPVMLNLCQPNQKLKGRHLDGISADASFFRVAGKTDDRYAQEADVCEVSAQGKKVRATGLEKQSLPREAGLLHLE